MAERWKPKEFWECPSCKAWTERKAAEHRCGEDGIPSASEACRGLVHPLDTLIGGNITVSGTPSLRVPLTT